MSGLLPYAIVTAITLPCFKFFSKMNGVRSDGPYASVLPRAILYSIAFFALTDCFAFLQFQTHVCKQSSWVVLALELAFLVCAALGAAFFAYDTSIFPTCNWAVNARTCSQRPRPWSVTAAIALGVLFTLGMIANNVLTSLVATGLLAPLPNQPCLLQVPPSATQGMEGFVLDQVGWLSWALGIPIMFIALIRSNIGVVQWHFHHYGIALFLGVCMRGSTIVSWLLHGAAWGVMLQGCWAAFTDFMLEPVMNGLIM